MKYKNKKISIWKTSVILVISFVLVFTSISSAFGITPNQISAANSPNDNADAGGNVFKKQYHSFYQFINDHEYMFAPLSGAISGAKLCGPYCALAGAGAGAIDEVLVNYGYADKRYLTWLISAYSTVNLLNIPLVEKTGGIALGLFSLLLPGVEIANGDLDSKVIAAVGAMVVTNAGLVSATVLTSFLSADFLAGYANKVVAPAVGTAAGAKLMGATGAVIGGGAGIVDELLIAGNYTDKHYFTSFLVSAVLLNSLGFNKDFVEGTVPVVGTIAVKYEKDFISQLIAPIKTIRNLHGLHSDFIPEAQLNDQLEKQALMLVSTQFIIQFLILKSMKYQQNLRHNFEQLDKGVIAWDPFIDELVRYAAFLVPYLLGHIVSGRIESYFSKNFEYALEDKILENIFQGEMPLRVLNDENSTVSMDNLSLDVSTIAGSGAGLITSAITASIDGAYGAGVVMSASPNIFIYSTLYNQIQGFISKWMSEKSNSYSKKCVVLESNKISVAKHNAENIRSIVESGGVDFIGKQQQQIENALRECRANSEMFSGVLSIWWSLSGVTSHVINFYLVANEINIGRLKFEDRALAQRGSYQLTNFLGWPAQNTETVASIDQAIDRVISLKEKINTQSDDDKIKRESSETDRLVIKGLRIDVKDKHLVAIDDLTLEMGNVYAITGDNGTGKSSFLSKINSIKENGILGEGTIYYPKIGDKEAKIVMVSQSEFFPLDKTLVEVLYWPNELPKKDPELLYEKREEIRGLLTEMGLAEIFEKSSLPVNESDDSELGVNSSFNTKEKTEDILDIKRDWHINGKGFTGGAKKRAMILAAILRKPDILLLDEAFAGIDHDGVEEIQGVLKKYLPNTLILSVDHDMSSHNRNGFYDQELHFADKKVEMQEIHDKFL